MRGLTPAADGSGAVVYVYGIARGDAMAACNGPLVEGIIPGMPVELLPIGNLAVVMNRASREIFIPSDRDGAPDTALATQRALAHHNVLATLAAVCTIAPVKFGALCRDINDLLTMFASSERAFEQALERVAGAREWGVKLFADIDICRTAAKAAPAVAALEAEIAAAAPGKAFFLSKRLRAVIDQEVRGWLDRRVNSVQLQLASLAREAAPNPIGQQSAPPASPAGPLLILDCAYLIDTDREAEFYKALADLGRALSPEGVALKLTGPWPPYSFSSVEPGGATDG